MIPIRDMTSSPPLIVRVGALGDMVLLTPLLDVLVRHYGCACDLIGSRYGAALFHDDPRFGHIYTLKSYNRPYPFARDQWELVRQLRARPAGPVFLLDTHSRVYRLLIRGGVKPENIVSRGKEGRRAGIHVVKDNLKLAGQVGIDLSSSADQSGSGTRLIVSENARKDFSDHLAANNLDKVQYCVIQAGTSRSFKRKKLKFKKHWPEDRWVSLIKALLTAYPAMHVFLSGAPVESEFIDQMARNCDHPRVISLAKMMNIPRLLAMLDGAACCISVDTGPAHVAAAVGCPLIVLFGGTYPGRMAPVSCGSPVLIVTGPRQAPDCSTEKEWLSAHNMLAIAPEMVMEAVNQVLQR